MSDEGMTDEDYRVKLQELLEGDPDIEVDADALVSREAGNAFCEEGAFVQAWVWVPADD